MRRAGEPTRCASAGNDGGGTGRRRDRGISAVEVVIAAPIMLAFILVLVSYSQVVTGRNAVDGAARDAARAGSLERSAGAAAVEAGRVARAQLGNVCIDTPVVTQRGFEPPENLGAGIYSVTVACEVRSFNLTGQLLTTQVSGTSSAPLDQYRRTE